MDTGDFQVEWMDEKYREQKTKKYFGWTFSPPKLPNKQITRFIHITKLSHKEGWLGKHIQKKAKTSFYDK